MSLNGLKLTLHWFGLASLYICAADYAIRATYMYILLHSCSGCGGEKRGRAYMGSSSPSDLQPSPTFLDLSIDRSFVLSFSRSFGCKRPRRPRLASPRRPAPFVSLSRAFPLFSSLLPAFFLPVADADADADGWWRSVLTQSRFA